VYAYGQPCTHPDRFFTAFRMTDSLFGVLVAHQTAQLLRGSG